MKVSEIMTRHVTVLDPKRLVGIVSLGDLARNEDPATIGQAVTRVSMPRGRHDRTSSR